MERILVIEDELPMRTVLGDLLTNAGYRVLTASDGEDGLRKAVEEHPDLLLLDVMLPKLDGLSISSQLQKMAFDAPILMLTARGRVEDRVEGLDSGASDYLVKPFSSTELLARVRALLRRKRQSAKTISTLELGNVKIDFARREATRGGRTLHLTPKEFATMRLLAEAEGAVVTREQFLDVAWGFASFPTTRTVDTHIAGLRGKIEADPANPKRIITVHGAGYRLQK